MELASEDDEGSGLDVERCGWFRTGDVSAMEDSERLTRLDACGVVSPFGSMSAGDEVISSALKAALLAVLLAASEEVVEEAVAGRRIFNLGGRVV